MEKVLENKLGVYVMRSHINEIRNNKLIELTSEMLTKDPSLDGYEVLMELQEKLNISNINITNEKCYISYSNMKIEYFRERRYIRIIKNGRIMVFITLPEYLVPFNELFNYFYNYTEELLKHKIEI